jgi:hypothetical protein
VSGRAARKTGCIVLTHSSCFNSGQRGEEGRPMAVIATGGTRCQELLKIKASGPNLRTATGRLAARRWLADPPAKQLVAQIRCR